MWTTRSNGGGVQHNRAKHVVLVRYALLVLIVFMLACTTLAILLVSFAFHNTPLFTHQTQGITMIVTILTVSLPIGIIIILSMIMSIYLLGLYGIVRTNLVCLAVFSVGDSALAVMCIVSTHHGQHVGNLGALAVFVTVSILSIISIYQTIQHRVACHSMNIASASVNCYRNNQLDDWFDFDVSPYGCDDKDELLEYQEAMAIESQQLDDDESRDNTSLQGFPLPPGNVSNFCTIETNEEHYLHGKRYAV